MVVSDNGPGIPSSERESVFEHFYRVVGNESTGSGLGLSIVRSIAELHGGRVEVRDRPTGTGVSFVVRLPEAGIVAAPASAGAGDMRRLRADLPG